MRIDHTHMVVSPKTSLPFWLSAVAVLALGIVGGTIWWQTLHYLPGPWGDDIFDRLRYYRARPQWDSFLAYLIVPHNEHRIATTRLIEIADERLFSGRETLQLVLIDLLQISGALGSFYLCRRYIGRTWTFAEGTFVAALLLVLFVNANLFYTLVVPFQIQHTLMAALCLSAAGVLAWATQEGEPGVGFVAIFVVLAAIATVTIGNAPVILLAVAAVAVVLRWRLRLIGVLAVLALAHAALMLVITPQTGSRAYAPVVIFKFLVLYLGGAFMRVSPWPAPYETYVPHPYVAVALGVAILVASGIFALWRFLRPGAGGPLAVYGLTVIVMVIITGLAAGVSRGQFGVIEAVNKKYASFAALAWVGLFTTAIAFAHQYSGRRFATTFLPASLFYLVVLPLNVAAIPRETGIWQRMIDNTWESAAALFAGVGERNRMHDLYPDDNQLKIYVDNAKPLRRGLFAHVPTVWGGNTDILLGTMREVSCRSEVEALSPVRAEDLDPVLTGPGQSMSMSGWTWMENDEAPPRLVLALDGQHRVAGAAFVTRLGARAEEWLGQKLGRDVGWYGFARQVEPGPLEFVALSRTGHAYCRLGHVGDTR